MKQSSIVNSFGGLCQIFEYLTPIEAVSLQQLNKNFYNKKISGLMTPKITIQNGLLCSHDDRKMVMNIIDINTMFKFRFKYKNQKARSLSGAILTKNGRYFICGNDDIPFNKVFEYNFFRHDFVKRPKMLYGRRNHSVLGFSDLIIVTGGIIRNNSPPFYETIYKEHFPTNKCEVYDILENKWSLLTDLNISRFNHTSFEFLNKLLYVYGGIIQSANFQTTLTFEKLIVDRRNFTMNEWELISLNIIFSQPCYLVSTIHLNSDEILIFGGYDKKWNATKECMIFNKNVPEVQLSKELSLFHLRSIDNVHVIYRNMRFQLSRYENMFYIDFRSAHAINSLKIEKFNSHKNLSYMNSDNEHKRDCFLNYYEKLYFLIEHD